jgi:5-methylcytosine-specific restriction endonuclease McrA
MDVKREGIGHVGRVIKGRHKLSRTIALRQDWHKKRFKKQGGICAICGRKMFKAGEKCPQDMRSTLDHIIPLSKGGSDHWENTQAVHNKCNKAKGDRMPPLALESENKLNTERGMSDE